MIDVSNPADVRREAERRASLRARGISVFSNDADAIQREVGNSLQEVPCSGQSDGKNRRVIDPIEYELDEKAIEHACDQLAQKAGGRVVRFSHPGKTQQTPGIADRLYCFPRAELALWFEVKSPHGQQRPGQVVFEELVTASGHRYACGGIGDLRAWLLANGVARLEDL